MAGQRPLPFDTQKALTPQRLAQCRNLGLLLDKFSPWERYLDEKGRVCWDLTIYARPRPKRPVQALHKEAKGIWLSTSRHAPADETPSLLHHPRVDSSLLAAHLARWEALARAYGAKPFELKTETRLVVGLGADCVLETALTLHSVYGYPVIPGSALKGLARIYALLDLAADLGVPALSLPDFWARKGPNVKSKSQTPLNRLETLLEADLDTKDEKEREALRKELKALQRDPALPKDAVIHRMNLEQFKTRDGVRDFRAVFGYLGRAGGAIFFDAVPKEVPKFAADVMNVHYPQYYSGERPPHDAQQPNPISFLTIEEGTTFCFAVGTRHQRHPLPDAANEGQRWLEAALREVGVGAKTTSGYGLFR